MKFQIFGFGFSVEEPDGGLFSQTLLKVGARRVEAVAMRGDRARWVRTLV